MTKAEERALEAYNDMFHNPEKMSVRSTISPEEVAESNFDYKEPFKAFFLDVYQQGYEQAEKDLTDAAMFSSGPDGFYYGKGYQQGMKDAKKNLGWHSVEESLPPIDEEVIVLTDDLNTAPIYKIAIGHIVDRMHCSDYNGWNIPGVKYWMPMPKLPKEGQK